MTNSGFLEQAVKSASSSHSAKRLALVKYKKEIENLMGKKVALRFIKAGLGELGIDVTTTWLRRYLMSTFPELYEQNYRKKGADEANSRKRRDEVPEVEDTPDKEMRKSSNQGALSKRVLEKYKQAVIEPNLKRHNLDKKNEE